MQFLFDNIGLKSCQTISKIAKRLYYYILKYYNLYRENNAFTDKCPFFLMYWIIRENIEVITKLPVIPLNSSSERRTRLSTETLYSLDIAGPVLNLDVIEIGFTDWRFVIWVVKKVTVDNATKWCLAKFV